MRRGARTLLGFDFGKKFIGVAVGQELTGSAAPLETLRTRNEKPDWAAITRLIDTWKPDALIVGIPLNMDDSEQEMSHASRRFARQLEGRYRLPVYHADERLSSVEAVNLMYEDDQGGHPDRRKRGIDEVAAQIILQTWLSEQARRPADTDDDATG